MYQGGQPQRVLASQGMVRPGVLQERQHWVWLTWKALPECWRLPYTVKGGISLTTRPVPARRPDPRLSHPVVR